MALGKCQRCTERRSWNSDLWTGRLSLQKKLNEHWLADVDFLQSVVRAVFLVVLASVCCPKRSLSRFSKQVFSQQRLWLKPGPFFFPVCPPA